MPDPSTALATESEPVQNESSGGQKTPMTTSVDLAKAVFGRSAPSIPANDRAVLEGALKAASETPTASEDDTAPETEPLPVLQPTKPEPKAKAETQVVDTGDEVEGNAGLEWLNAILAPSEQAPVAQPTASEDVPVTPQAPVMDQAPAISIPALAPFSITEDEFDEMQHSREKFMEVQQRRDQYVAQKAVEHFFQMSAPYLFNQVAELFPVFDAARQFEEDFPEFAKYPNVVNKMTEQAKRENPDLIGKPKLLVKKIAELCGGAKENAERFVKNQQRQQRGQRAQFNPRRTGARADVRNQPQNEEYKSSFRLMREAMEAEKSRPLFRP